MPVIRTLDDRPVGPSLDHVVNAFLELEPGDHTVLYRQLDRDMCDIKEIVTRPFVRLRGDAYRQGIPHKNGSVHVVNVLMGYRSLRSRLRVSGMKADVET